MATATRQRMNARKRVLSRIGKPHRFCDNKTERVLVKSHVSERNSCFPQLDKMRKFGAHPKILLGSQNGVDSLKPFLTVYSLLLCYLIVVHVITVSYVWKTLYLHKTYMHTHRQTCTRTHSLSFTYNTHRVHTQFRRNVVLYKMEIMQDLSHYGFIP